MPSALRLKMRARVTQVCGDRVEPSATAPSPIGAAARLVTAAAIGFLG